jgi:SAM-dependent methyltransferase
MKGWADYWNADTPIYVSQRHKALHYRGIARDILVLMTELGLAESAVMLDYGSGEALSADLVARRCERLCLADAAPLVRERLAARFADNPRIAILAPNEVAALPDGLFDLILVNSLTQYLSASELDALLAMGRIKLSPDGALVLADIIPPDVSPATDALALLRFAWRGGFLGAALAGLVRTALSDYRKLRGELGLTTYIEAAMLAKLAAAGFKAERRTTNLGHNPARMTFIARPV